MISLAGMSMNKIGWFVCLENSWKSKFEFWWFLKKFGKVLVVVRARVSCLLLVNLLAIYRVNWERKNKAKRFGFECIELFSNKIKFWRKFDFLINVWSCTKLASVLGFLGPQVWYKITLLEKISYFHILYNLILN